MSGATASTASTIATGPSICDITFETSGTVTFSRGITSVDVIAVGGGGEGGDGTGSANAGGGGGGGQVVAQAGVSVTNGSPLNVTVGGGGTGGTGDGANGTDSTFSSITASGGQGGKSGALGTGGAYGAAITAGGSGGTGPSTVNGIAVTASTVGGGGSGAGGIGGSANLTSGAAGNGGAGAVPTAGLFSANSTTYSAGGGGGAAVPLSGGIPVFPDPAGTGTPLLSGFGGNSDTALSYNPGTPQETSKHTASGGYVNTGGGGGGGVSSQSGGVGAAGGSGIVRIRYELPVQIRYVVDSTNGWESLGTYGTTATIDGDTDPNGWQATNAGYTFAGWSTTSGGPTVDYVQGNTVTRTAYLPLYPVWTPNGAQAPSGLTATSVTSSSSSFTWTNPSSGSWTGSQLAWRVGSSGAWTVVGTASSASSGSIALPAGATVQVQVVSFYGAGSLTSAPITVNVPNAPVSTSPPSSSTPPTTPTPTPTPSATSTPVAAPTATPTPGGSVMPTGPLAPNLPGTNSAIPATGVPLGGSVMLVNGQVQSLTVKPAVLTDAGEAAGKEPTALAIEGDGFTMSIAGLNAAGKPLGLTPDGALILEPDRTAAVQGTGFQPNSEVELYLFSDPRYVGKVMTNPDGSFKGSVPLPTDVPAGRHTLQSNGFTPDGQVRSISLGVQLNAESTATTARRPATAKATVYFASLSSDLDVQSKAKLRSLARKAGLKARSIKVIGYVQKGGTDANDQALSLARAQAVASYLRSLGMKGAYAVSGGGVEDADIAAKARKASVIVRYLK